MQNPKKHPKLSILKQRTLTPHQRLQGNFPFKQENAQVLSQSSQHQATETANKATAADNHSIQETPAGTKKSTNLD